MWDQSSHPPLAEEALDAALDEEVVGARQDLSTERRGH
jgi:hypothetical protein